ncbi:MAG TPA: hypothetical protein VL500_06305 [Candidatus Eisenbacteria bacterium]|jgi:hypothetical protein|nr:hypothetical protein [Candidatus Eisenbacteria bacterium]
MNKLAQLAFLMFVASATSGCGALFASAGVESRPGDYHVNGYTSSPEAYASVASHNYVQEYNAETYRRAVESGRAYPYQGGMTGDYWMYYRGVVPAQPVTPVAPPPAATSSVTGPRSSVTPPTGDALAEAREARRRADAALRMHARLRARMEADEAAEPPPSH